MLKLQNVSKYYHSNDVVAMGLRRVNLEFELGEFIAVTGESGSGKSTLLNVISGLDTYEDGEMYVSGEETSYFTVEDWENYRKQYIGFVFQNYNIIDSYSVLDNVMLALTVQGYHPKERKERALELIEKVGLSSHVHHKASKLSGGQKQRCVIARALAKDCPIIVADEPTGNLDRESSKNIIELLQEISKNKLVIVVTHNFEEIKDYATRKIRLFDGEVAEDKQLQPKHQVDEVIEPNKNRMNYFELVKIAAKNLYRTPRRSTFSVIVSIFIVAVFIFGYGAYLSITNDSGYSYNRYFQNASKNRVIVTNFDNSAFTSEELKKLGNLDRVIYLNKHDVLLDAYLYRYYESEWREGYYDSREGYMIPAAVIEDGNLKSGRLPKTEFEVVIEEGLDARTPYKVGDTIYFGNNWFPGDMDFEEFTGKIPFTIVGVVGRSNSYTWEEKYYFHSDFFESDSTLLKGYFSTYSEIMNVSVLKDDFAILYNLYDSSVKIGLDNSLADGEVRISPTYLENIFDGAVQIDYEELEQQMEECWQQGKNDCWNERSKMIAQLYLEYYEANSNYFDDGQYYINVANSFYAEKVPIDIVIDYDEVTMEMLTGPGLVMNGNTLDAFFGEDVYQISLMVKDGFDAKRVQNELNDLGYRNIYPAGVDDQSARIERIFNTITFGFLFGIFIVISYFVSYVVLRNIQLSKKKDYLVFRSIGANKRDLNRVTIFELVIASTIAYIITFTLFFINENVYYVIPRYLRYFEFRNYVIVYLMLTFISLLLGNRFNKRIFNRSVITALKQE